MQDWEVLTQTEGGLAFVQEFIDTRRVTLIDIGEDERTFSSSEVREKVCCSDNSWRKLTMQSITDYILKQNLYVAHDIDAKG